MSLRAARLAFAVALVVHLLVLYVPRTPATDSDLPLDKAIHVTIFAAVAWTGIRAGFPMWPLAGVLLAHAIASEIVQDRILPARSGDWADVVADAAGIALILLIRPRPVPGPG